MWQYPLTIGVVLVAALLVVRAIWRAATSTGQLGCGSGCGKCAAPAEDKVPEGRIRLPQV